VTVCQTYCFVGGFAGREESSSGHKRLVGARKLLLLL